MATEPITTDTIRLALKMLDNKPGGTDHELTWLLVEVVTLIAQEHTRPMHTIGYALSIVSQSYELTPMKPTP